MGPSGTLLTNAIYFGVLLLLLVLIWVGGRLDKRRPLAVCTCGHQRSEHRADLPARKGRKARTDLKIPQDLGKAAIEHVKWTLCSVCDCQLFDRRRLWKRRPR